MPADNMNSLRGRLPFMRYPLADQAKDSPFMIFTAVRPTFKGGEIDKGQVKTVPEQSVALYVPRGVQVSDSIRYENIQGGIAATAIDAMRGAFKGEDVVANYVNGASATAFMARLSSGSDFIGSISRLALQREQVQFNPHEFILFDAPNPRTFSYTFKFMPESLKESEMVEDIIKYFRKNMYPEFANGGGLYKFPKAFQIKFRKLEGITNIPEVVLTDVSVTHNANSMSYHEGKKGYRPIETDLVLTFKELVPITSEDVSKRNY